MGSFHLRRRSQASGSGGRLLGALAWGDRRRRAEEELHDAQARYRSLVEQLPLVTYIESIDPRESTTFVSPQIEEMLGYGLREWENHPELLRHLVHPDDLAAVLEQGRRSRSTGDPRSSEYRMLAKDGRVVWVQDRAMTVRDRAGWPLYTQGFLVDITARKQAEAERDRLLELERAQNERLRELDRLKDEFVALVSHELRTPLTSICGYLEVLLDEDADDPDERAHFLRIVDRNAKRLHRLVGDLLFVAQVDAGRLALERGDCDLPQIAEECIEAAAPAADENEIAVALATEPLPLLDGDRSRLAQLLDNLIANAIKFTPAGGRVDLRVGRVGGCAVLEVADTGIGIATDEQARLFERFFRASSATEQAIPGTGLGLAIAKAIVGAHGGEIAVESVEGTGTTFRVLLPFRVAGDEAVRAAA